MFKKNLIYLWNDTKRFKIKRIIGFPLIFITALIQAIRGIDLTDY